MVHKAAIYLRGKGHRKGLVGRLFLPSSSFPREPPPHVPTQSWAGSSHTHLGKLHKLSHFQCHQGNSSYNYQGEKEMIPNPYSKALLIRVGRRATPKTRARDNPMLESKPPLPKSLQEKWLNTVKDEISRETCHLTTLLRSSPRGLLGLRKQSWWVAGNTVPLPTEAPENALFLRSGLVLPREPCLTLQHILRKQGLVTILYPENTGVNSTDTPCPVWGSREHIIQTADVASCGE